MRKDNPDPHPPRGPYDDDAVMAAMRAVADYARSLQIYGVFILSPVCPSCGQVHDFSVISDLMESEDADLSTRGAVIAQMMRDQADAIEKVTPSRIPSAPTIRQH